jgi:hypothetical protein
MRRQIRNQRKNKTKRRYTRKGISRKRKYIGGARNIDTKRFQEIYDELFNLSFNLSKPVEVDSNGLLTRLGRCIQDELREGEEIHKPFCIDILKMSEKQLQDTYRKILNEYASKLLNIAKQDTGHVIPLEISNNIRGLPKLIRYYLAGEKEQTMYDKIVDLFNSLFNSIIMVNNTSAGYMRRPGPINHVVHLNPVENIFVIGLDE